MNLKNISDEFCKLILNTSPQLQGDNKPTPNEISVASLLFEFLQKLILDYKYQRNTPGLIYNKINPEFKFQSLDGDYLNLDNDNSDSDLDSDSDCQPSSSHREYEDDEDYIPEGKIQVGKEEWSMEEMKKVVNYMDENPTHGYTSIQSRFRKISSKMQLKRIKDLVEKNGRYTDKVREIERHIRAQFMIARRQFHPVHDSDLKRWAISKACAMSFNFKGSAHWLNTFKRKYHIKSRKISAVYTNRELKNQEVIDQSAIEFRQEILEDSINYPYDQIFNSDQSGYTYEYHSTRTLSTQGEKLTAVMVRSPNNCTHSYTIQLLLDYNGKLRSPLCLCTQEPKTGKMGDQVKRDLFHAYNVEITCSKSGKLTSSLFKRWVEKCLLPNVDEKCLLLLDSWTGQQSDENFSKFAQDGKSCVRKKIPKKTTGSTQPLDVYYNRQWKGVVRKCYDRAMLDNYPENMGSRNNIIKMHSLIHHQFSNDQFVPMGQYAWYAAGLRADSPGTFKNANEILFPSNISKCMHMNCSDYFFIRCAYCNVNLCFNHFFKEYHNHMPASG